MGDDADATQEQDCAVCLQKCHHPTQLPCGHVFCFLCVKGVAIQSRKCAMCRAAIPSNYLDNPVLLEKLSPHQGTVEDSQLENQWYYEGRNGWWKYDERSNIELEASFNSGDPECTLLLAGALYCINFQSMTQVRCSNHTRRRRVRRETPLFPAKGVAGIKSDDAQPIDQTKQENDDNINVIEGEIIEIIDDDDVEDGNMQSADAEIITVDDVRDEFERLRVANIEEPES